MIEKNINNDFSKILPEIRKDFYRYRNGVVAESLKCLYPAGKTIFGLLLPQLMEISRKYPENHSLGLKLWEDKSTRESRLLAIYLINPEQLSKETALEMIKDVCSNEEAEFLAFKLLRNLPFANEFLNEIIDQNFNSAISNYCVFMFKKNLTLK